MNDIDLRTALHHWADETPAGQPPVAELIGRGVRRRRRRTAAGIGAGAAAAVVLAAGAAVLLPSPDHSRPTAAPPEPGVELAAAISSTSGQSFRFAVESELTVPAHHIEAEKGSCSGMLDPVTRSGYVKMGDLNEHWAVNGKRYLRVGKHHYTLGPGDVTGFIACPVGRTGDPGFVSADPAVLLRTLTGLTTVHETTSGEMTVYAFTAGFQGTVTVSGGKVRSLTTTVDSPASGDTPAYHRQIVMTLSAYGEPVRVQPPW